MNSQIQHSVLNATHSFVFDPGNVKTRVYSTTEETNQRYVPGTMDKFVVTIEEVEYTARYVECPICGTEIDISTKRGGTIRVFEKEMALFK